jgi:hypothetical protein
MHLPDLPALLRTLRECQTKGQAVENPEAWHDLANQTSNIQAGVSGLLVLANIWGYQLDVSSGDLATLSAGTVVFVGLLGQIADRIHTAASSAAGRPPKS